MKIKNLFLALDIYVAAAIQMTATILAACIPLCSLLWLLLGSRGFLVRKCLIAPYGWIWATASIILAVVSVIIGRRLCVKYAGELQAIIYDKDVESLTGEYYKVWWRSFAGPQTVKAMLFIFLIVLPTTLFIYLGGVWIVISSMRLELGR